MPSSQYARRRLKIFLGIDAGPGPACRFSNPNIDSEIQRSQLLQPFAGLNRRRLGMNQPSKRANPVSIDTVMM